MSAIPSGVTQENENALLRRRVAELELQLAAGEQSAIALERSAESFDREFLVNAAPQIVSDPSDGRMLDVNAACCQLLGYAREDLVGRTSMELNLWSAADQQAMLAQLEQRGSLDNFEINVRTQAGEQHTLLLSSELIELRGRQCLVSTGLDITDRKRIEEQLRFQSRLLAAVGQSLVATDSWGRITYWNQAAARMYGWSHEEVLGRDVLEVTAPDLSQAEIDEIQQKMASGQAWSGEFMVKHRQGAPLWIQLTNTPIMDSDGRLSGIIGIAIDCTERRRTDDQLRRWGHIFQHARWGIVTSSQDGAYLDLMNPAFAEMHGYTLAELEGQPVTAVFAPDERPLLAEHTRLAHALGHYAYESRHVRKDGAVFPVWIDVTAVRDEEGNFLYRVVNVQDITERKRAEQERESLLHELRQSHAELQHLSRQLIDAQEGERRRIARELHDDFGQSLTGLKIVLEMAARLPAAESLARIRQAQQVTGELIERASQLSLNLRPPMLDDMGLLAALLWLTQTFQEQTSIQLEFVHSGLQNRRFAPAVETAAYRLVQEAMTNIARHAEVDQAVIRVAARETQLVLDIWDAGRGVDVAGLHEHGQTSGMNGMRERVHLLNGEIAFHTSPGHGMHIIIQLPLDEP